MWGSIYIKALNYSKSANTASEKAVICKMSFQILWFCNILKKYFLFLENYHRVCLFGCFFN